MEITLNVTLITALIALLLTGGIFLFAFQAFLLKGVHAMLDAKTEPLKENQIRIEKELEQFKKEIKEVNIKLDKLLSK